MFAEFGLTALFGIAFVVAIIIAIIVGRRFANPTIDATEKIPHSPAMFSQSSPEFGNTIQQTHYNLSPDQLSQITQLSAQGQKIAAIKHVREWTGLGLAEAKNLVDRLDTSAVMVSTSENNPSVQGGLSQDQIQHIRDLAMQGNPIEMLKHIRDLNKLGFQEIQNTAATMKENIYGNVALRNRLTQEQLAEVRILALSGNKINAIKRVRELTGLELAEAKQIVDNLA